jgi:prevent-host-death family protein
VEVNIMKTAGIKELKNRLSSYLTLVKKGEEVLITDRGKPIARIISEDTQKTSLRRALQPLIMEGLVNLPADRIDRDISIPVELPGKQVSEMVSEDRR